MPSKPTAERAAPTFRNSFRWSCQLLIAVLLSVAGLALLFLGFWLPPEGEIHSSVLVGFGEVSTFAGALFGVEYRYRSEHKEKHFS